MHCDSCRQLIADDTAVCPHCGTGDVHGWLGTIAVLVVCGVAALLWMQSIL
jgi:RNA polymerase subunit RPABC4/transcription elongation factor Spt4